MMQSAIRELALLALKEMLCHQPVFFTEFIKVACTRILGAFRDPAPEVTQAAEEAMDQMVILIPTQAFMEVRKNMSR